MMSLSSHHRINSTCPFRLDYSKHRNPCCSCDFTFHLSSSPWSLLLSVASLVTACYCLFVNSNSVLTRVSQASNSEDSSRTKPLGQCAVQPPPVILRIRQPPTGCR